MKGGKLADILSPGTYSLTTDNFPVLPGLKAFPCFFVSPEIADVYFVSTRQFIDYRWATGNSIMKRDKNFNMVRIRSLGKFTFRIIDVPTFMWEIFGTKGIVTTYDIIEYLSSMVTEAFTIAVGVNLATEYRKLSGEVEKLIDEQSGIGMAKQDMDAFM